MDHPLNAYLSTALTGLTPPARQVVDDTVTVVRDLTGRVGIDLYFPGDHTDPVADAHVSADEVYRIDRERVKASDLILVLAGAPSFGVGQELTMAHESLIPTVLLIPEEARVSRMTLGVPLKIEKVVYGPLAALRTALEALLRDMLPRVLARRAGASELDAHRVGARIGMYRERAGISREELAAAVGMTATGLGLLEASTDRQADPSLTQMRRIAAELGVTVHSLV